MFSIQNHATSPSFSSPKDLQLGIISTSPCLFCFPENSKKKSRKFRDFCCFLFPQTRSHIINPPSPEAKAKARGRLLCLHMLAQHLGANEGDAAAAPAHPGFVEDAGGWGGWFFATFCRPKHPQKRLEMFRQKMWRR